MIRLLYSSFPTREEALNIARILLQEKLIACANVVDNATSVFSWQGEVKEESEVLLFAKTSAEKSDAAIARIKNLHSYEVPAIVALPIDSVNAEFMHWVKNATSNE